MFMSNQRKPTMTPNLAKRYANFTYSHGNNFNLEHANMEPGEKTVFRQKLLYNYQPSPLTEIENHYFWQLMWVINTPTEMIEALDGISELSDVEKDNVYDMYIWFLANQT